MPFDYLLSDSLIYFSRYQKIEVFTISQSRHLQAEPIWGTSVYRILISLESDRIKKDFNGTMTLFERRHEAETREFSDLDDFVNILKNFWNQSLTNPIQDTRLARWLVEYLLNLGVSTDYNEILDVVRGEFQKLPEIEMGEEEEVAKDELTSFISEEKGHVIKGTKRKIQMEGRDVDQVNEVLDHILNENKPVRSTKTSSTISFKNPNGEVETLTSQKSLDRKPLEEETIMVSGFKNSFSFTIEDLNLDDVIPYDYELDDVNLDGPDITKIGEELGDDGLHVKWNIPKLEPGQNAEIEYVLGKKVMRTILIRDDDDVTTLQTYEGIIKEGKNYYVDSTHVFQSHTPVIENVKILDQIPSDFILVSTDPEAREPIGRVNIEAMETEIIWTFTDVRVNSQHVTNYEMKSSPQMLRDKIDLVDENEELVAKILKVVKPLNNHTGYGMIFAIKTMRNVDQELLFKVSLDAQFEINPVYHDSGNIAELSKQSSKEIVWKLDPLRGFNYLEAYFQVIGEGKYDGKLSLSTSAKDLKEIGTEAQTFKRDSVIMPPIYSEKIDA